MGVGLPEEIGGYRLLGPLGAGGMGTVYRARDGDGRVVALKLLHAHLGADPEARERLTREVASLRRVRHPGVARVLDAEIDSSDAFVVTELVKGQDLAAYVRTRGPLPADELAELADRLRAALVVVHRAGVLHRDLTPGNVMVTDDGPVLIDFGVAQAVEDARVTSTGLVAGTPGYLAPELLEGGQPSAAGDWWGWAALLAFAATGRPPFGRGTVVAQLNRARTGEVDLAGVDRRVAAALRSALAVDPWRRAAPDALVAELRGAAARAEPPEPEPAVTADNQWRTRVLPAPLRPSAAEATDDDWAEDEGETDEGEWPGYDTGQDYIGMGPEPARRRGTVLAAAMPLVALALARPGTALAIGLVLAVLVRSVGLDADAVNARRARRGRRGADVLRAGVTWPWFLLRAAVGAVPSAAVAASVVVLSGGLAWWLLDDGRVVLAEPPPGELAGVLAGNAEWVGRAVVATLVAGGLVALWFGPLSRATRTGARWTLAGAAPGLAGAAAVALLALGVAVVVGALMLGQEVSWWPMTGPPDIG